MICKQYLVALVLAALVSSGEGGSAFAQGLSGKAKERSGGNSSASSLSASAPGVAENPPPSDEFELGIGDVVHISVWRETELTETAVVRPDGRISMPLAGEITIAGKNALQAQSLIRSLLIKYFTDPQVTVSIVEIHSRQVFITGQVQRPGAYPLLGNFNVLQLIASAGGLTPYAHKKNIVILDSNNQQVFRFDYASTVKGNPKQATILHPGETVVVP